MTTTLSPAEQFYYDYAGWGYNPGEETEDEGHRRCARELAIAAEYSKRQGWTYDWLHDVDGCLCIERTCASTYLCLLCGTGASTVLASLGGICDPDAAYVRVIEAELALEAMPSEELHRAMGVRS